MPITFLLQRPMMVYWCNGEDHAVHVVVVVHRNPVGYGHLLLHYVYFTEIRNRNRVLDKNYLGQYTPDLWILPGLDFVCYYGHGC